MRENMPGTHGWVERFITPNPKYSDQTGAYTDQELATIIRKGKDRYRNHEANQALTMEETILMEKNRTSSREDLAAMEAWAAAGFAA